MSGFGIHIVQVIPATKHCLSSATYMPREFGDYYTASKNAQAYAKQHPNRYFRVVCRDPGHSSNMMTLGVYIYPFTRRKKRERA